jgi:hypothetical protein
MKKLLLSTAMALAIVGPASADVMLENKLSGTGDNVIFNSLVGNLALGSFNGQHVGFVHFDDLGLNPLFTAAANGNDIKIANTNNLSVEVFDAFNLLVVGTQTQVFSLKGTGDVTAFITAVDQFGNVEPVKQFDLGVIDPNAQSGFTFTAYNGEIMTKMVLVDVGGQINDYEHYRIDVAAVAVPGPVVGAGLPGIFAACVGLWGLAMRRRKRNAIGNVSVA